ncbi:hypothetical protein PBI_JUDY_7 [Arthrobacter phage Judy]|uniref:Uncharacterized protein n=1 Tax=Arthrobacter phage Judy TaxID=2419958 RepID=A0A3G2KGJ4_9CAUD|nr:hypothetical protein HOU50_gp07 [Arthrobacter phage Judy]AYN58077.1 hypothetical protein PBI_JUDY_7 [Arthrobacter phage Judy]
MATGRTTEGRTVTVTTASNTTITGAAGTFVASDVGRTITRAGIPAGTTITAVASGTSATISAAATTSATSAATLGSLNGQSQGIVGWSPETDTEAGAYSVAATNAGTVTPDRLTNAFTPVSQRGRG